MQWHETIVVMYSDIILTISLQIQAYKLYVSVY